ncbi:conserved hypothetical protein [Candidatus Xenohaliotis californiensis]|uniref:Uncharacterized protein n=1 Tax=Candidatus Xenohaliotis californiensis TaxID=84677 RepID=A0ABP0EUW0_9RICK|nr:conserved hypothetical protein [Candidatus Xenohaliotis californiensis]
MTEAFWREPSQTIVKKKGILMYDRGKLTKAIPSSTGDYLFSEVGSGISPLVVVGTIFDITEYLYKIRQKSIVNKIKETPEIYMSISQYKPEKQFESIYSIGDNIITLSRSALSYVPSPSSTIGDFLNNETTFLLILKELFNKTKEFKEAKGKMLSKEILYLRLHYLQNDKALKESKDILLGEGSITLESLLFKLYKIFFNVYKDKK